MNPKERYLQALLSTPGAVMVAEKRKRRITLRNGTKSVVYFNHRRLMPNPEKRNPFVDAVNEVLRKNLSPQNSIVGSVDSTTSPLLSMAIINRDYRYIVDVHQEISRKEGWKGMIWMPDVQQRDNIVIIDDVMTPGDTTIIKVAKRIREELARRGMCEHIYHAIVGVVRDEEVSRRELRKAGIILHAVATDREVLRRGWNNFTEKQKRRLKEEYPDLP